MVLPVVLAATIHDGQARLLPALERLAPLLRDIFAGFALNLSDATPDAVAVRAGEALDAKIMVHPQGEARIGRARRDAVKLALDCEAPHILYSDFDHVLRWAQTDARELRATLAVQPEADFLVVGRSERAFAAEPERLRETERLVNRAYALLSSHDWDLMFAVRRLSRRAAEEIVRHGVVDTVANDVEWPLLAERAGCRSVMRRPTDCSTARWRISAPTPTGATAMRWNGSAGSSSPRCMWLRCGHSYAPGISFPAPPGPKATRRSAA
jgi:hypothetical protein